MQIRIRHIGFTLLALGIAGCSIINKPRSPEDVFLSQFNVRSGVRYPNQASSVLHTVAGHLALSQGGLPAAGRYFDEVARLYTEDQSNSETTAALHIPIELELTRSDIALQLGDLSAALSALQQVDVGKLDTEERLLLAGLSLEHGDENAALALYKLILSEKTTSVHVDEAYAFSLIAQSRIDKNFVSNCDVSSGPISLLVCGRICEGRGDLEQALKNYRLAQEAAPDLKSIQLDQYRALLRLGRSEEVVTRLQKTFRSNPAGDIGKLLNGVPAGSVSGLLQEITRLSPGGLSTADLRGKLAALELRAARPKSALRQLSFVLAVEPTNDSARYLRASLLAASGRRPEARADLLQITPEQPAYGQARLLVAQLARLAGDLEQAQSDLRPYVDRFPNDKLGVLTYLSLLKERGKFEEGLTLIAAIRASNPSSVNWLGLERAHLLKGLGRDAEALEAAKEVLGLDDENAPAQNFIAYDLATHGQDLDLARELAERAVAADAEEPFYLDTLGWVMFKRGNLARAAELLNKALDLSHGDIVVAEHLGDVLEAIEPGRGQSVYRTALERARDNERTLVSPEEVEVRRRLESKVTK